jgi:hypothetical protein
MKNTSGPWFIDGTYIATSFNSGQPFVACSLSGTYRTHEETEGNLRLMAGSTLMYDTLLAVRENLRIAASGDSKQKLTAIRSTQGAVAAILEIIEEDKSGQLQWRSRKAVTA